MESVILRMSGILGGDAGGGALGGLGDIINPAPDAPTPDAPATGTRTTTRFLNKHSLHRIENAIYK